MSGAMQEYIVFTVASNRYGIAIDTIERIVNVPRVTPIPEAHRAVDGMISHEGRVIKVLNFRRLSGLPTYEEELLKRFAALKGELDGWVEALSQAVIEGTPLDTQESRRLLRAIEGFNVREETLAKRFRELQQHAAALQRLGMTLLERSHHDREGAIAALQGALEERYRATLAALERFAALLKTAADTMQRLLIYRAEAGVVAIKVDAIDDIRRVDEGAVRYSDHADASVALQIEGVAELDAKLVNIIKSVRLPEKEVK